MNEGLHSLFLAQALGLYLVIVAIIMLTRAGYYRELLTHLKANSASVVLGGTVGLILGILMVLIHNIWIFESEVFITLIAWLILIKSVLWLAFPECMVDYSKKMYAGMGYYIVAIVSGIIGIVLMAHGFYLFI